MASPRAEVRQGQQPNPCGHLPYPPGGGSCASLLPQCRTARVARKEEALTRPCLPSRPLPPSKLKREWPMRRLHAGKRESAAAGGIEPGSFLGLMLAERHSGKKGERMTDQQVRAGRLCQAGGLGCGCAQTDCWACLQMGAPRHTTPRHAVSTHCACHRPPPPPADRCAIRHFHDGGL